jgi:hypothetical protein
MLPASTVTAADATKTAIDAIQDIASRLTAQEKKNEGLQKRYCELKAKNDALLKKYMVLEDLFKDLANRA